MLTCYFKLHYTSIYSCRILTYHLRLNVCFFLLCHCKSRHVCNPLHLAYWVSMTASDPDWYPQAFEVYFRTMYPSGLMVRCLFVNPHDFYTSMKHLFSKSTELAFKALLLSSGKYRLLISDCLYLSWHHLLEDSRACLVKGRKSVLSQ